MWICLWGHALKRSPGIIHKSKWLYPGPWFLSSATLPSLPKKAQWWINQSIINNSRQKDYYTRVFFAPDNFLMHHCMYNTHTHTKEQGLTHGFNLDDITPPTLQKIYQKYLNWKPHIKNTLWHNCFKVSLWPHTSYAELTFDPGT